jgi:hypothetical protein
VGENFWVPYPAGNILVDHLTSLHKYRPIRPGTPAPYTPPKPESQEEHTTTNAPDGMHFRACG